MNHPSFEFIPREDIPSFVSQELEQVQSIPPPPVPPMRSPDEILASSAILPAPNDDGPAPAQEERPKRVFINTTATQRSVLILEFTQHGITKPLSYYEEKTRLHRRTLTRLIKKMQDGEDISKPGKRGRKPKYTPELLKTIASDLCTKGKTMRETQKGIIKSNIEKIESGDNPLPEVALSTIHRYVSDDGLMREVDIGPISFTEVTIRGPAANSPENKELRILRRRELDALINAGFMPVFVDESHWTVGNVRTRGWGPKGEKHYRTTTLASFSLSCVCMISQAGDRHCKIFNTTINADIFKACMRELIKLVRLDNENVVLVMDNASIHRHEIVELAESNGCKVLFNAPYSPECNPIEMVFGTWKTRVGKLTNADIADLLHNIAECFETIERQEIRRHVAHFLGPVTVRVMNREDL